MPGLKIAQVATADVSIRFLLMDQIKALQSWGHEVIAVCHPGPWVEEIRGQGVTVETVPMQRELQPLRDLRSTEALYQCFRRHQFDIVHTHTPKAGLIAPLAARLARVPVVIHTIHGLLFHDRMPRWRCVLFWFPERFTASFCDFLLSQSREDLNRAARTRVCTVKKLRYLGNGIEIAGFSAAGDGNRASVLRQLGLPDNSVIVGSVGRLVSEKGFHDLFAAAQRIRGCHSDVTFLVVGPQEPDQNDAISPELIASLQRSGTIRFLGWQGDMARWYSAMDIFVLPSYREGIPRACMEAAAMGCPVVATDIRGCREVVRNGETGILVPPRDPEALAVAIEKLIQNRELRRSMGQTGREHICSQFDLRLVLRRLQEFYAIAEMVVRRKREQA